MSLEKDKLWDWKTTNTENTASAGGLELDDLWGPFQPKLFYEMCVPFIEHQPSPAFPFLFFPLF